MALRFQACIACATLVLVAACDKEQDVSRKDVATQNAQDIASHDVAVQSGRHDGICDASAGAYLTDGTYVVADDELNVLRVFKAGEAQEASHLDIFGFLETAPDKESDIEGAARLGDVIYWISSHGRNSSGEEQKRRHRFFATRVTDGALSTVGAPVKGLLPAIVALDTSNRYGLAAAIQRAPEAAGGFNIEGLAVAPDGKGLLIGLRNPVPNGKALVITLQNPEAMVMSSAAPEFGGVLELDLGGSGVRSLERVDNGYLIVAGPTGDDGPFRVIAWDGRSTTAEALKPLALNLGDLRPEGLLVSGREIRLLSDDGGVMVGTVRCKDAPVDRRSFATRVFPLP